MIRRLVPLLLLFACVSGAPHAAPRRVVLVSFDGLGADELAKQRDLPAFARLAREGLFVQRVTPVTPSVTSSAHVAILTGTTPDVNGIVANKFHVPGTPWSEVADGFNAEIHGETLLEAAHRQGKRVGSIAFPTIDANGPRRTADFGLLYSDPIDKSRTVHMTRDELAHYKVDSRGWFAVADGACGSWSKVITTTADDVTVYWGAKSCTSGYPESFQHLVTTEVGFWPGPPDANAEPSICVEQNARLAAYLADVTALAIHRMPFDLLLAYEPIVDQAEHRFLGTRDDIVARSFVHADRAVHTIASGLDPSNDALVVTGDHGLAHIEAEVHLKTLLDDPNWLPIATGGGVANLYKTGSGDTDALAAKLAATGYFERIDRRTHPNNGDLVLYAWPHIVLAADGGEVVTKSKSSGQHGGIGTHHELQTVLFAWGAGVTHETIASMQQTAIASFVARLLGINTPRAPAETSSAPRGSLRR